MIDLKLLELLHQWVFLLASLPNAVIITLGHMSPSQKTIPHRTAIYLQEIEPMYRSLALEENNQ